MAKMSKVFAAVVIIGCFFIFPAAAQSAWTRANLQSIYMEHLRLEGYVPLIDIDGDIQFKVSGDNFFIIVDENDLQFFQIYTGFSIGSASAENALTAANYSNRRSKVAKVAVSSDGKVASITAELLLSSPLDFASVFARSLSLMRNAENNFLTHLNGLE
ncbi:MAG: hypothetical protein FWC06_00200 [Treponema sp.]|nr:hypothetical protein [Treponema sp.]